MKPFTSSVIKQFSVLSASIFLACSVQAAEPTPITACVFSMMGEAGPEYQGILDYQAAAMNWGAKITLKNYINETVAAEEFKSGVCDIAVLTSLQARKFNKFTATVDAASAIPGYEHLKIVLDMLSKPSAEKYMRVGEYETVGIMPIGAVYMFTNDRKAQSPADMAGKRMAVLDNMPEFRQLVVDFGMTPVSSTLTNMYQKFNNGAIDVTAGPGMAYEIMELHKGMEPNGGIVQFPVVQGNMQFVARWNKLPEGYAQKSREYFVGRFDQTIARIKQIDEKIPSKWWIPLPQSRMNEYEVSTRKIRLTLRDKGFYDPAMLTILRKVRCKVTPSLAECTAPDAE